MKLRLKSHSVRFRITTEEMEQLAIQGVVSCGTTISNSAGQMTIFRYEIRRTEQSGPSELHVLPDGFSLWLNPADYTELIDSGSQGVYLRRPWTDGQGRSQRCVIYVEKDKPKGHKKHKKEKHKRKHHDALQNLSGSEITATNESLKPAE